MDQPEIRRVNLTSYITPLREGGSLPAICGADDGFNYVVKFKGAGQGQKSLIAELLGCFLAKALHLKVPEPVFCDLDPRFGKTEPDEEIQDLLKASTGLNLGIHYLQGSTTFDPAVTTIDPLLASRIVWLDALIKNVDRTVKNTNMLWWQKELWLIDHGASFYFHHSWNRFEQEARRPFPLIKDHVLLPVATELIQANEMNKTLLNPALINAIVELIPEEWLLKDSPFEKPQNHKDAYKAFLTDRLSFSAEFIKEALDARKALI